MEKIFITGGTGFIAGHLTNAFKDEASIIAPPHGDLDASDAAQVRDCLRKHAPDLIFHCATQGGLRGVADAPDTMQKNLAMLDNLLRFKKDSARLVFFSSGAMYDKSRNLQKIKESDLGKCVPRDLYGLSKMKAALSLRNRKDALCLTIFGCYGIGERETRFPTYAVSRVLKKEPVVIRQNVVFDYLFIDDLIKIVRTLKKQFPADNILNATPTQSVSLTEIAETVNSFAEEKSDIRVLNAAAGNAYTGDNALLLKNCPNLTFTPYVQGLRALYDFLNRFQN